MDTGELFHIYPFSGASSIRFGMSPPEVEQLLGTPNQVSKNYLKQRVEFRSFMNVAYTADSQPILCHIGFGRQMENVVMHGINLFRESPSAVIEQLESLDHEPMLYLGFIVFHKLGIALTGFHDKDDSQKAVTLFEKGAWDNRKGRMTAFRSK